jgi:hypothetical protein
MKFKKHPKFEFGTKIILVLILKVLFLSLIWFCCFRHPQADQVNDQAVVGHAVEA